MVGVMGRTPGDPPRGDFWGFQGGGQQEEDKDLRRLADPKGSADLWRPIFPRATSEGFLLCRSSAGAELCFP